MMTTRTRGTEDPRGRSQALGILLLLMAVALLLVSNMRRLEVPTLPTFGSSPTQSLGPSTVDPAVRARVKESFGKMPIAFTANGGQYDERVRFAIEASDKTVYFTDEGLTFVLTSGATATAARPSFEEGP